jgi:DNA-binding NarL/FixJ family response regulator
VARGGSRIDPDVVGALVRRPRGPSALSDLTGRELEVLEQMAQGCTNRGIAQRLHLSESSVEKYATSLFSKLGLSEQPDVHRRVAAVLAFLHDQGKARPLPDHGHDG